MSSASLPAPVAAAVQAAVSDHGSALWLVGGAVRDSFLERTTFDFDFAVDGPARRLARQVAANLEAAYYDLDDERDAGRVVPIGDNSDWQTLDFARLRADTIDDDLALRDFTINALAQPFGTSQLIDPTGGLQDLRDQRLRQCRPDSIERDPIRALRAVRLAQQLALQLSPELTRAVKGAAAFIDQASAERLCDELFRLLSLEEAVGGLRVANQLGLLGSVVPSAGGPPLLGAGLRLADRLVDVMRAFVGPPIESGAGDLVLAQAALRLGRFRQQLDDELRQCLAGNRTRRQLLLLVALHAGGYCPGGPAQGGTDLAGLAHRLRLSSAESQHLAAIGRGLAASQGDQWLAGVAPLDHYRYYRRYGPAGVELVLLALACRLAVADGPPNPDRWQAWLDQARAYLAARFEQANLLNPEPLIRGDELARALDRLPGPWLGEALEAIREAQISGQVRDRAEAVAVGRRALAEFEARMAGLA